MVFSLLLKIFVVATVGAVVSGVVGPALYALFIDEKPLQSQRNQRKAKAPRKFTKKKPVGRKVWDDPFKDKLEGLYGGTPVIATKPKSPPKPKVKIQSKPLAATQTAALENLFKKGPPPLPKHVPTQPAPVKPALVKSAPVVFSPPVPKSTVVPKSNGGAMNKYDRMRAAGVPEAAIENAMRLDSAGGTEGLKSGISSAAPSSVNSSSKAGSKSSKKAKKKAKKEKTKKSKARKSKGRKAKGKSKQRKSNKASKTQSEPPVAAPVAAPKVTRSSKVSSSHSSAQPSLFEELSLKLQSRAPIE